jgi:PAS domain-containing protein
MWARQAEAARVEGVSRQWIHALVKQGRLQADAQGRVNLVDVRRLRGTEMDPARGNHRPQPGGGGGAGREAADTPSPGAVGGGLNWQQARTAREAYMAKLAQLDLEERQGKLVRTDAVERQARALASAIVRVLAPIPERIAKEFAADETQRRRMRERLQEELTHARAALAAEPLAPVVVESIAKASNA